MTDLRELGINSDGMEPDRGGITPELDRKLSPEPPLPVNYYDWRNGLVALALLGTLTGCDASPTPNPRPTERPSGAPATMIPTATELAAGTPTLENPVPQPTPDFPGIPAVGGGGQTESVETVTGYYEKLRNLISGYYNSPENKDITLKYLGTNNEAVYINGMGMAILANVKHGPSGPEQIIFFKSEGDNNISEVPDLSSKEWFKDTEFAILTDGEYAGNAGWAVKGVKTNQGGPFPLAVFDGNKSQELPTVKASDGAVNVRATDDPTSDVLNTLSPDQLPADANETMRGDWFDRRYAKVLAISADGTRFQVEMANGTKGWVARINPADGSELLVINAATGVLGIVNPATPPPKEATVPPTKVPNITPTPTLPATPSLIETQRPPTFHEILDQKGITLGVDVDNHNNIKTDGKTIVDNFNKLIPGYFSWGWIRRNGQNVNTIDLNAADQWVNFAGKNGMKVQNGNALVYNVDLPKWLTEGKFTPDDLRKILTDHISAVVGHFKGRVSEWIVCNEAYIYYQGYTGIQTKVNETGADFPFATQLGEEYIELAFKAARQADPGAILIYNDFDIEIPGPKADWVFEHVKRLKEKGVLDAVGFQMHFTKPPNLDAANPPSKEAIVSQIKRYKDIGVDVIVTELDVDASRLSGTQEQKLARQAEIYKMVIEACLEGGVKNIAVWGLNDADSYLGANASALLFANNQPKPAFQAIKEVVSKH